MTAHRADPERVECHVRALEGVRHPLAGDRAETLDFGFMARVADAAAATVLELAGQAAPPGPSRG